MKVLVGLSGGVDSAIAAYLLQQEGYEVSGGFMRNWDALANNDFLGNPTVGDSQCPQEKDYDDATLVAKKLGIPLLRADFVKEYWDNVFSFFLSEYEKGRTPNPDVFCNKYIKFDSFYEFAKSQGFEKIAMGHYAKLGKDPWGAPRLFKALDKNKDQTYFLCQISAEQVASCLFPLGDIEKPEVRRLAHELGLSSVMDKKDSTGVCFIGERHFKEFLQNYMPAKPGKVVLLPQGKEIGTHSGVYFYTIGQHRGLGIGGIKGESEGGYFVVRKDVRNNILYVCQLKDRILLSSTSCKLSHLNLQGKNEGNDIEVGVKFRYRQPDQPCILHIEDNGEATLHYEFHPVEAVTPGQIAAIYQGDMLLGGGIIEETYRDGVRVDQ
ncbi:MAG: tRNA 2-thiouridine(34) synthase MnmA [Bacilli bacterium]|nr:tRNA 2-thiouridine(34) synthase MnmA [Bacilli bacterium]